MHKKNTKSNNGSYISDWIDKKFKYLAVTPVVLLLVFLSVYPLAKLFIMSFSEVTFEQGQQVSSWLGLGNYLAAIKDNLFRLSFYHTLFYIIISVGLEVTLGFTLALVVNDISKGKTFYRTVFLLPFLIPPVVNGTMWGLMYNNQFGLINLIIEQFGLDPQRWLSQPKAALMAIIVVSIWQWTGYNFLLMLAGLQAIPKTVLDAAQVDGATGCNLVFRVIIPIMKPTIIVMLMFRIIHAFKGFDLFYVLTGGGPGHSTEIINIYIQKVFMTQQRFGYGSALSVISIIMIGIVAIGFRRGLNMEGGRR